MASILEAYTELAADEGIQSALDNLQHAQVTLETLYECGSPEEKEHAFRLLLHVNNTIGTLLERKESA